MKTNSSQLSQLLRLEIRNNGKKYLTWIGIIFIALAAISGFTTMQVAEGYTSQWRYSTVDPMEGYMETFFWLGFVFASCIFSSQVFAPLGSKGGSISNLMLPATQLNKYLIRWFLFVPVFIIAYTACFELVDLIRYIVLYYKLPNCDRLELCGFSFLPYEALDRSMSIVFTLLLSSFFVLGSSIWPKRAFVYTALSLAALAALCTIVATVYFMSILNGANQSAYNHFDSNALGWTLVGMGIIGILINYTLAYFRYKEIEIIQRW